VGDTGSYCYHRYNYYMEGIMNAVEKAVLKAVLMDCIEEMEHVVKVYCSLSERGKYPQELCPFDLSGASMEIHPLFLGKQGFIKLVRTIEAAKIVLSWEVL